MIDPAERISFDEANITEDSFEQLFSSAIEKAEKENTGLYCGEYGVIDIADPEDALKWYKVINAVFERHSIGRAAWNYKGKDFGIIDDHMSPVRDELIKYL
jgi:hypothetical protein